MQNGLYVAASGLLMQSSRVDTISNNLANVNTTGFKKEMNTFTNYRPVDNRDPQNIVRKTLYNRTINSVVMLEDNKTNFEIGHLTPTDDPFDFALEDANNFFVVDTPMGIRFTRDGTFSINNEGELVTKNGHNVLDNTGAPITIPEGARKIYTVSDGDIHTEDGALIATMDVVTFADLGYMQKVGENLFAAVNILPEVPANPTVRQGFLESSNVDPITEMVHMIDALRGFEMYQKVVHTFDQMNEQAASQIAKV